MENLETPIETIKWQIDPVHSQIEFSVSHMVISRAKGYFKKFEGTVITENDSFENAQVELNIDAKSIDTNNEQRDTHLRSPEFFDAERHQKIIFKSTSVKKTDENTYQIQGDLSLRGLTRQIEAKAIYYGSVQDPYNNTRSGFNVTTAINRKEFGVNWNGTLDSGGLIAGDVVEITANLEIVHE